MYNYTSFLTHIHKIIHMKSERLDLVIPAWLKEQIKEMAKQKGITMSEYIKDVLKGAVQRDSKK